MSTVAVIVSAKGAQRWLAQCIYSIATQSLPPGWRLRIVIGVDACAATLAVARRLRFPNLVLRNFPDHVGPYVVFNSLACNDDAEVFVRFDADDVMLPGYIASQLSLLDDLRSPRLVQTWSIYVDSELRPLSTRFPDGTSTDHAGRRSVASDGQFLFTRPVWNRLGGFQGWWCSADTEFVRRARWSGVVNRVVPAHLYLRRAHSASLTKAKLTTKGSDIRNRYTQFIKDAGRRYAAGAQPEWVYPLLSRHSVVPLD